MSNAIVIEPRRAGAPERVRELVAQRSLFGYFARRAVERSYKRTLLGRFWLVIRPLMDVGARALIFGSVLNAPGGGVPYFLFFLVGMTGWRLFDRSLFWATRSLEMNRSLLRKLYFPRLILPGAAMAPAIVEFAVYAVLVGAALAYYWVADGVLYLQSVPRLLAGVAGLLLGLVLAWGLGLFTSVLGAEYRDMRFSLRYALDFWFYLTPVIYPLSALPAGLEVIAAINPMTGVVELIKWGIIGAGSVQLGALAVTLVWIVISIAAGLRFFSRAESAAIDRL